MKKLLVVAMAAVAGSASAIDVVVANQYATTPYAPANGLNTFIRDLGNARTGQLLIDSSQLSSIVGMQITGFSMRLYNGATSPWTGGTWNDYEIRIGAGVDPSAGTGTLANNFVGTPTLVQDGALTMSGFTSGNTGSTPNAWSNVISFQTPFSYTGGDLCFEVRHGGQTAAFPAPTFAEAVATTGVGYGTQYRSFTATGQAATTGAQAAFTMVRFTAVPEPATMAVLGLGVLPLLRRRRK